MQHRLIGYWRDNDDSKDWGDWPHPSEAVDHTWLVSEREKVASYLEAAPFCRHFRGYSSCRICGINNGSAEHYDGVYLWPQGLAHYVRVHAVRLPDEFIAHINSRLDGSLITNDELPKFDYTQIDYTWWFEAMAAKK